MTNPFDELRKRAEGRRSTSAADPVGKQDVEPTPSTGIDIRHELSRRIDQLRCEINTLKKTIAVATGRSRDECLEMLGVAERKATRLRWHLLRVRGEANHSWEAIRGDAEASLKELRKMVARVSISMREESRDTDVVVREDDDTDL